MLLPIGTDVRLKKDPTVTYLLIGLNMLLFALYWAVQRATGDNGSGEMLMYVKQLFEDGELSRGQFHVLNLCTYQFIHAGWLHVIGNMIFLLPFGKVVEDRLGHVGFLALYLGCGMVGGILHVLFYSNPVIGASGSVCGITAAFATIAPKARIRILFVFFIITMIEVPGLLLVLFQIAFDSLNLFGSIAGADGGRTAWVVHLGGYATGMGIVLLLFCTKLLPRGEFDLCSLITQAKRRRTFRSTLKQPNSKKEKEKDTRSPSDRAQARITRLLQEGQHDHAMEAYRNVLQTTPAFRLAPQCRIEVANSLVQGGHVKEAAALYESYLSQTPTPEDAPTVALFLAAKYIRTLGNSKRSVELLELYAPKFTDEHSTLAEQLKREARTV
ncbi:MAG: rhomboid family intramembrane serine protease [Phycisphaerales bacterium]|nr:rhomboid family intramembrane serine protease [Phycisphaerales bacterium]